MRTLWFLAAYSPASTPIRRISRRHPGNVRRSSMQVSRQFVDLTEPREPNLDGVRLEPYKDLLMEQAQVAAPR